MGPTRKVDGAHRVGDLNMRHSFQNEPIFYYCMRQLSFFMECRMAVAIGHDGHRANKCLCHHNLPHTKPPTNILSPPVRFPEYLHAIDSKFYEEWCG